MNNLVIRALAHNNIHKIMEVLELKRRLYLTVLTSFAMVFALFNVNIGAAQAEDLPYEFVVSEILGQETEIVTLFNPETMEPEDYEIEFNVVPSGATLSFTPEIDFGAVVSFYYEEDGIYWDGPEYWHVDGALSGYNYVEANQTAEVTFEASPNSFYELVVWEEGYEESYFFKVQGGDDEPVVEPKENDKETVTEVKANPTSAKLQVNGKAVDFTAYSIAGNNYFKLRDLAMVVSGSEKQFEVGWDAEKNAINLISGSEYTPVGGELEVSAKPKSATGKSTTSTIYMDGQEIELTAYNIGGNNYFKLRDIAQAFNIGVTWDGATRTIGIDTSIDYIPE